MDKEFKKCSRCSVRMHISLFPSNLHGPTGVCNSCRQAKTIKTKKKNRAKVSITENGEPITTWLNGSDELYC